MMKNEIHLSRIFITLGAKIKQYRRYKKITLKELSERINISTVTLWSIEKGSPSVAIGTYLKVIRTLDAEKEILGLLEIKTDS